MKSYDSARHVKFVMDYVFRKYSWQNPDASDLEGMCGVACLLAYFDGCKPDLISLSTYLGCKQDEIRTPFRRLMSSGIFSKSFDARNDKYLKIESIDPLVKVAWANIAALSSDIINREHYRETT